MAQPGNADPQARLGLLYELSCSFASKTDLAELIPLVIDKCREVLQASGASILVLDPDRDELYFPFVAEEDPEAAERLARIRVPAGRGISGEVLRSLMVKGLRDDFVCGLAPIYGVDHFIEATTQFTGKIVIQTDFCT